MNTLETVKEQLKKFVPEPFVPMVADLLFSQKVLFKVSKPRKTKLGDYKPPYKDNFHRISVNGNLNKWAFLVTTLHEFAHMHTYLAHGNTVKSHGAEWKNLFAVLLKPVVNDTSVPNDIRLALQNTIQNTTASSCTDLKLTRVLRRYDKEVDNSITVEELKPNEQFILNNKLFKRGKLRRKRYLCTEIETSKLYLIHCLAQVQKVK